MRFSYLAISQETAEKIVQKHHVTPEEAREAFATGKIYRGARSRQSGYTYIVRGRTYAGRRLWVLVRPSRPGVAALITAREDS